MPPLAAASAAAPSTAASSASPQHDRMAHDRLANAIRALAMDAVEQAKSGHPGLPMGAADIATVLFTQAMKFDPNEPAWPDRDRFVLSAGHGSMLLYAVLHLLGYPHMTIAEIKRFRQSGSLTPGHPESHVTPGVETTTGPLGQGLANAVGMAIAEAHLAAEFGKDIVDHHTYVLASDGDLMEGISQEAIALAGHLKLGKLVVLFDDNGISIDGPLSLADSVDQVKRFEAAGWAATRVDGHDPEAIAQALEKARASSKPSLIACKTTIGFGAPTKAGSEKSHGSPLGADEIKGARERLGWTSPAFEVPADVLASWRSAGQRAAGHHQAWKQRLAALPVEKRAQFERRLSGKIEADKLAAAVRGLKETFAKTPKEIATRAASELALDALVPAIPELVGGSADLTGSNNTKTKGMAVMSSAAYGGRFIHYGVREHGMAAAMNGMALHGGMIPYSGTFLVFSDYCRPAIRLAALMGQRVIHVMTHDSIGLGEDGPTHQPVEHLAALRAIPGLVTFRPGDANEIVEAWKVIMELRHEPAALVVSRQAMPTLDRARYASAAGVAQGAYVLADPPRGEPEVILMGTGSEVSLCVAAYEELTAEGVRARVVSMPSWELFERQPEPYRESVLPAAIVARVAVEQASTFGWAAYAGPLGEVIGMKTFGASAPLKALQTKFGFTPDRIVAAARATLARARAHR